MGLELVRIPELLAQHSMVVDLTIDSQYQRAVLIIQRLCASVWKVSIEFQTSAR